MGARLLAESQISNRFHFRNWRIWRTLEILREYTGAMRPLPLFTHTTGVETSIMQSIFPIVLESRGVLESQDFRENPGPTRYFAGELSYTHNYNMIRLRPSAKNHITAL
jgi:hypothetical protein